MLICFIMVMISLYMYIKSSHCTTKKSCVQLKYIQFYFKFYNYLYIMYVLAVIGTPLTAYRHAKPSWWQCLTDIHIFKTDSLIIKDILLHINLFSYDPNIPCVWNPVPQMS